MKKLLLVLFLLPVQAFSQGAVASSSVPTSSGGGGTVSGSGILGTSYVCVIGVQEVADSVCLLASKIVFEGATADAHETTLTLTDPTADRTITLPNLTGTVAVLLNDSSQIFGTSADITIAPTNLGGMGLADAVRIYFGTGNDGMIEYSVDHTPDSLSIGVSENDSMSVHILATDDIEAAFDFENGPCGTSICTDPTVIIHSVNQATGEWISLEHNQTTAIIQSGTANLSLGTTAFPITAVTVEAGAQTEAWTDYAETELLTLATGGVTTTSSGNLLRANSRISMVVCHITTTITTAVNFDMGIGGDTAKFVTNSTDITDGNDTWGSEFVGVAGEEWNSAAAALVITTDANPGAGAMRCTVFGRAFSSSTS